MAPLETYIAGDVWVSDNTFDNTSSGAPVDPSTVMFAYSIAGGTPVYFNYGAGGNPQIIRLGTGDYQISIDTTTFATQETGTVSVQYIWASQGLPGQGVREGVIQVQPPVIPLDFTEDLGSYLVSTNNLDDVADVATSRTNLGLGTAAVEDVGYFDLAGDATAAQAAAESFATAAVEVEQERALAAEELLAPLDHPIFTNAPEAPTQSPGTDNETIATTEYADLAVLVETTRAEAAEEALAEEIAGTTEIIKVPVDLVSLYSSEVPDSPPHGLTYTIDEDVANTPGMRVLLVNQSTSVDNGLWEVNSGTWTRTDDWAHGSTIPGATLVYAKPSIGEWLGGSVWEMQANPIVVGTDSPAFFAIVVPASLRYHADVEGSPLYVIIPVPVIGDSTVTLFSYDGNPNGNVTSVDQGDICFSVDPDFLGPWKATADNATTWVRAHTGPHSIDSGSDAVALGDSGIAYSPDQTVVSSTNGGDLGIGAAQASWIVGEGQSTSSGEASLVTCAPPILTLVDQNGAAVWNRTIMIHATVVARRVDVPGTDSAWESKAVLRGDGTSAYSWVGGSAPTFTVIAQDSAAATWTVALAIEDHFVFGTVTGSDGETINWEITLELHEVAG